MLDQVTDKCEWPYVIVYTAQRALPFFAKFRKDLVKIIVCPVISNKKYVQTSWPIAINTI